MLTDTYLKSWMTEFFEDFFSSVGMWWNLQKKKKREKNTSILTEAEKEWKQNVHFIEWTQPPSLLQLTLLLL